jgi:hypothetical protein
MTRQSWIRAAGISLLTFGCSSVSVKTQYDAKRDFAHYQTFALAPDASGPEPGPLETPQFRARLEQVIARALEAKGFRRVPPDMAPDLRLNYRAYLRLDRDVWVSNWGGAVPTLFAEPGYPSYEWDKGAAEVREYEAGNLVLDVHDVKTDRLVWSGTAHSMTEASRARKMLLKEARELAQDFPRNGRAPAAVSACVAPYRDSRHM